MGIVDTEKPEQLEGGVDSADGEPSSAEDKLVVRVGDELEDRAAAQLGTSRYILSAFFAVGIAAAYVVGRTVDALWSKLATTQSVVDQVSWLTYFEEESRGTWSMVFGGAVALAVIFYVYRRRDVRTWVDDAASELAKVTWPGKDEVINGTIVVVVASLIAMVYLMLLDRFWGFVTDIVYRT